MYARDANMRDSVMSVAVGQSGYQHVKDAVTRYYTSRKDCPLWIAFELDRRSKDGKQEEDCE